MTTKQPSKEAVEERIASRVRHMQAAEAGLTEMEARVRALEQDASLYRDYDAAHMASLAAPGCRVGGVGREALRGSEPQEPVPEDWEGIEDLPVDIRAELPPEAQVIFLEAHKAAAGVPGIGRWQAMEAGWAAVKEAGWHRPIDKWVKLAAESFDGAVAKAMSEDGDLDVTAAIEKVAAEQPELYDAYDRGLTGRKPFVGK